MELNQTLTLEPESIVTIRFQDCDPFGHLNNARYVDYFMNARQDHIREHYGLEILKPGQSESWVVNTSKIAFLAPAQLSERVRIRTRLIGVTDRTITVEGLMLNEAGQRLKSVLWLEFTYVSLTTGRPVNHPEELMSLFHAVLVGDGMLPGFDQRIQDLRAQYRRRSEAHLEAAAA